MNSKHIIIKNNFYKNSKNLRGEFEKNFSDPRQTHAKRFVWDYWNLPNQYNLIRTPAYHYFPEKMYYDFHKNLVQWGQENLGCHDISPTWLSYYIEGCKQELHSDVPHGPWAFVYSLTPQKRKFSGGETVIFRKELLNYWQNFTGNQLGESTHELNNFMDSIPPNFNRLIVFDPRFPHAVSEVKGVRDPLDARLVIHGWFVEPRPYVVGGLSLQNVQNQISDKLGIIQEKLSVIDQFHGTMSFQLKVGSSGWVLGFKFLTNTVISLNGDSSSLSKLNSLIKKEFVDCSFKNRKQQSAKITIPILFK